MSEKVFTIDEARRTLDRVRPAAEQLCSVYHELACASRGRVIGCDSRIDRRYFAGVERIHGWLGELGRLGVQVKDLRTGLLDFPVRRAGRVVLLCWRVGEPSLAYWHEVDAGFAGRRPFDVEGPWDPSGAPHEGRA